VQGKPHLKQGQVRTSSRLIVGQSCSLWINA